MPTPVRDLARLLREMRPRLHTERVAFCALADGAPVPDAAISWFREAEGVSIVVPTEAARASGLAFDGEMAWITLEVHSALDAVGLTAAVSAALTAEGIPCNVVAALRHDHLFVPSERSADAMRALGELVMRSSRVAGELP
jgi:uncharacterized protein